MDKPVAILKIGTAAITKSNGELDQAVMVEIARQIGLLHHHYQLILVSSGAVGNGKMYIKNYTGTIIERKAAAAIGNPILLQRYAQFLAPYNINIAQSLCERSHFANKDQFDQLKQTFKELWKHGIIPIANENDVVSNLELKFSDNDELATLLAVGFGASILLMGTSVNGLLNISGKVIPQVSNIDEDILSLATSKKSQSGLGGMISKLTFARLSTKMGIETVIFNIRQPGTILQAIKGETGTVCRAHQSNNDQREQWLSSGNIVRGKIQVKKDATRNVTNGQPIFLKDVKMVIEPFAKGEVFEILGDAENSIGVARAQFSSLELPPVDLADHRILATPEEIILL